MTKLGDYLRELRGQRSLREVADLTHGVLSHNTIARAERGINTRGGEYIPGPEVIKELAQAYHVDLDKLMHMAGYINDLPPNAVPVTATETVQIPVYGEIQAGVATLAEQNVIGQLDVKKDVVERYGYDNLFALKVRGESMNRKIINGHTAVFCKDIQPESGDIVAVMIDHEDATVKRYKETSLAVMFEPESWDSTFKPYVFPKIGEQDFKIIGKYIYDTSENI